MSDVAVREDHQPTAKRENSKPLKVTGRLKRALDFMVWGDGEQRYLSDNEAAVKTGMNVLSIRWALQQPHVLAYYKQQRQVLIERESPANIHRAIAIRDKAENMPAVNAIKLLEDMRVDQQQRGSGLTASPGVTIRVVTVVQQQPVPQAVVIEGQSTPQLAVSDDTV